MALQPRHPAPKLVVPTVGGAPWSLEASRPETFTMIVVYRSLHCPLCKNYLGDLEAKLPQFAKLGVEVIAASVDTAERAARAKAEWGLANLRVGYGLSIDTARQWGLFISGAQKDSEPNEFTEPGLFLVKADGTLYTASIANTPWARPPLDQMLRAIDFFAKNNPPARGESR